MAGAGAQVEEHESDGADGLLRGEVGARVTVRCADLVEGGYAFEAWAAFLAPLNDMQVTVRRP